MKHSWRKIKELICQINRFLCLLRNEVIAILPLEVFLYDLKCFFVHAVSHRFADAKDHVQHQVPVIVVETNGCLVVILV